MFLLFSLGGLIWTLIIGLIVGIIAKAIMPGKDPGGFFITAIIGMVGGIVGGFLDNFIPWHAGGLARFIFAIIGAVLVLWVYRMITAQKSAGY